MSPFKMMMRQLLHHAQDGLMLQKMDAIIENCYKDGRISHEEKVALNKTYAIFMDEWRVTQK